MNHFPKTLVSLLLCGALLSGLASCVIRPIASDPIETDGATQPVESESVTESAPESESIRWPGAHTVILSDDTATLDGEPVEIFDYTWHADPSVSHDEVKNAPAEYHTGTAPETEAIAYIDHDLPYYPALSEDAFTLINYDGEREWAAYYTDGEHDDYIFGTLPALGRSLPIDMMHTEEEAAANQVLHLTEAGTYVLTGTWNGQILVDLGDKDETFTDPDAKVTLILDGADISCSVAPGVVFYSAYECDNGWEDRTEHTADVDTSDAGAVVILADGSENTVTGTNVFRMLKTTYKDAESGDLTQKKMRKTDGAFYSYVTMNVCGEAEGTGSLTVNAGFEGMDSELHLSVNGGNLTINSGDDGMNVNEDNVSVISFNGGAVTINASLGEEGDGVDSNGFIRLTGGTIAVNGVTAPDSALDSEDGITYTGGTVIVDGEEQALTPGSVTREIGGGFGGMGGFDGRGGRDFGDLGQFGALAEDFDMKAFKEQVAALDDDATLDDVLALFGITADGGFPMQGGMGRPGGEGDFGDFAPDGMPGRMDGMTPPEMPDGGMTPPEMR